jgi:acetamidase/formamidase
MMAAGATELGLSHTIHNRHRHFGWSRDHAPTLTVAPGDVIEVDVIDSGGGAIGPETVSGDLDTLDRGKLVPLTGPIVVDGALPGDAVKISILAFEPTGWGWSAVTSRYGILNDQFPGPFLKQWRYDPSCAVPAMFSSTARVPLKPFPGIIGLAPAAAGLHPSLPPYRTGGNLDVRDLSIGTQLVLPVEVPGALLSLGDTHAAQGQGELAGSALESSMRVRLGVELLKDTKTPGPWFSTPGPVARHLDGKGFYVTCGISAALIEAARAAASHMIDLLARQHALDPIDAYLLCSVCGDLVISEMVNTPVHVVSLYFPKIIFE